MVTKKQQQPQQQQNKVKKYFHPPKKSIALYTLIKLWNHNKAFLQVIAGLEESRVGKLQSQTEIVGTLQPNSCSRVPVKAKKKWVTAA